MSAASPLRGPAIIVLVGSLLVAAGIWYGTSFRPRRAALREAEQRVVQEEAANRRARQALVRLGVAGTRAEIERLRTEALRLAELVPPAEAEVHDRAASRMRERIASVASRYEVEVPRMDPLDPAALPSVRVDGYRVVAWGEYHRLGAFMTALEGGAPRLARLGDVRLRAVPDPALERSDLAPRSSAAPLPPAAPPGAAVATFAIHWFTRVPSDSTADPQVNRLP